MNRFDLHTHSDQSDGTCSPSELVRMAQKAEIELFAVADHDTTAGVEEAVRAGRQYGVRVLPAVELDTDSPFELHILGLGIDIQEPMFVSAIERVRENRARRNEIIIEKLKAAGMDVRTFVEYSRGTTTRLHIAKAIYDAGYAQTQMDAFRSFLNPGCIGYHAEQRMRPEEAIAAIHGAGGLAVVAHPCLLKANPHKVVNDLHKAGIDGLEAYYSNSGVEQTESFVSLARQLGLFVTAGSDFHGENRPGVRIGMSWQACAMLQSTADMLEEKYFSEGGY